ncbi:hypothetical protein D3C83_23170 [compost metagenome]
MATSCASRQVATYLPSGEKNGVVALNFPPSSATGWFPSSDWTQSRIVPLESVAGKAIIEPSGEITLIAPLRIPSPAMFG